MRLVRVEISNFRSIFDDERAAPLTLDLADGMNALVGTNNCGKSNVLRAIALALDPTLPFSPKVDNPGPRPFSHPTVTLRFVADGPHEADNALLAAADAYESSVGSGRTYASTGEVVLRVAFEPREEGVYRGETLMTPSGGHASTPLSSQLLVQALAQLRDSVRFVMISSGESIRSVLDGNFREILHSVVKERLSEAFSSAEASRDSYVSGIQESLLGPLRDQLLGDLGALFPEIEAATLVPEVPTIDRTLSNVTVGLKDLVATPLSEKGTGVRGGVLVAMLSYLASNATRGMIFAVEEPEAFLHPAAQEDLRAQLEQIAVRDDVTLLVTTHSPYILTKLAEGKVFGLAKDKEGRTRIGSVVAGDGDYGTVVAGLFRDSPIEDLVSASSSVASDVEMVLIVEGDGDKFCLELACDLVGRRDLLDGVEIRPASGASKTVLQAIVTREAIRPKPVLVLLDNDAPGLEARDRLKSFGFRSGRQVLTYADIFPPAFQNLPIEAEDLFAEEVWQSFVEMHGQSIIKEMIRLPDDSYHYGFDAEAKDLMIESHLAATTEAKHVMRWIELVYKLRDMAGMEVPELPVEEIVATASGRQLTRSAVPGRALVVTGKLDYARYLRSAVLVMDTSVQVPIDVTHLGFYLDAEVKAEFAEVLHHYPSLRFSAETVEQLHATGSPRDSDVALVISQSVDKDDDLAGSTQQLLLLSPVEDGRTFRLDAAIDNDRVKSGKPLAWIISPRLVSMDSLVKRPSTTTELDRYEDQVDFGPSSAGQQLIDQGGS